MPGRDPSGTPADPPPLLLILLLILAIVTFGISLTSFMLDRPQDPAPANGLRSPERV